MSNLKNTETKKSENENSEKKKTTEPVKSQPQTKAPEKVKAPEPSTSSKSDRLDRMENQLNLIEDGLLVLINSVQWGNLSITPIGTHNPDLLIKGYMSLQEAVKELAPDEDEQISQ